MKKESKQNYTAPTAEATRSKITLNVLQTLSGDGSLGGWHNSEGGSTGLTMPAEPTDPNIVDIG